MYFSGHVADMRSPVSIGLNVVVKLRKMSHVLGERNEFGRVCTVPPTLILDGRVMVDDLRLIERRRKGANSGKLAWLSQLAYDKLCSRSVKSDSVFLSWTFKR